MLGGVELKSLGDEGDALLPGVEVPASTRGGIEITDKGHPHREGGGRSPRIWRGEIEIPY